jgi:hypothetical protein
MTGPWVKVPISVHAATWSTVPDTKKVLFVVHTVTSANRLLDLVHLFDSDLRVQLVFTCPDASAISTGVTELFDELGVIAISWQQAIHTEWDLAITAKTNTNSRRLSLSSPTEWGIVNTSRETGLRSY